MPCIFGRSKWVRLEEVSADLPQPRTRAEEGAKR